MFDQVEGEALDRVAEIVDAMRAAVALREGRTLSPGNTPDVVRVEAVAGYEELIGIVQGLQAGHVCGLFESVETQEKQLWAGRRTVPQIEDEAYRLSGHEVAAARRVAPQSGQIQTRLARALVRRHPYTWRLVVAGRVSMAAATRLVYACLLLDEETCRGLDEELAQDALRLTPGRLEKAARKKVIRVDPDAAKKRARAARGKRSIDLVKQDDSMITLEGYLPAEDALACYQALTRGAKQMRRDGDTRTHQDLMCELFVARLTGRARAALVPLEIGLVVSVPTLAGCPATDGGAEPAVLRGYGPIPGDLARDLAASHDAFLRRIVVDPATGTVTGVSDRRCFDGKKRSHLLYRDQHCRWPGCERPIEHCDHAEDWAHTQQISVHTGQGLCQGHNLLKNHPKITTRAHDDGTITFQMPSGRRYTTRPPPALGDG